MYSSRFTRRQIRHGARDIFRDVKDYIGYLCKSDGFICLDSYQTVTIGTTQCVVGSTFKMVKEEYDKLVKTVNWLDRKYNFISSNISDKDIERFSKQHKENEADLKRAYYTLFKLVSWSINLANSPIIEYGEGIDLYKEFTCHVVKKCVYKDIIKFEKSLDDIVAHLKIRSEVLYKENKKLQRQQLVANISKKIVADFTEPIFLDIDKAIEENTLLINEKNTTRKSIQHSIEQEKIRYSDLVWRLKQQFIDKLVSESDPKILELAIKEYESYTDAKLSKEFIGSQKRKIIEDYLDDLLGYNTEYLDIVNRYKNTDYTFRRRK